MDLQAAAKTVTIDPNNHRGITVRLDDIDTSEIINQFSALDIINDYEDTDALLDEIGIEYIKEHFGLTEL